VSPPVPFLEFKVLIENLDSAFTLQETNYLIMRRYSFYVNENHSLICIAKLGPTSKTGGLWVLFNPVAELRGILFIKRESSMTEFARRLIKNMN